MSNRKPQNVPSPDWTNRPRGEEYGIGYRVIRTPVNQTIRLLCTCDDLIGCNTHYWGGRTIPHSQSNCPACEAGIAWVWHGYMSGIVKGSSEHVIFECTAACVDAIDDYIRTHRTLRGGEINARRMGPRANARISLAVTQSNVPAENIPTAPDIMAIMTRLWGLAPDQKERHLRITAEATAKNQDPATLPLQKNKKDDDQCDKPQTQHAVGG